jgi:hypothetical protein
MVDQLGERLLAAQVRATIENPIDGILPDFSIFGTEFTQWWQKVFAALWALALLITIFFLLQGIVVMANAGDNPHSHSRGRSRAVVAGISLVCVAAFGVIVGAILQVAG